MNIVNKIKIKFKTMTLATALQLLFAFSVVCVLVILVIRGSLANPLENDVEVKPKSELKYFLNVSYDGVDKNGVKSNDTTVSEINSGTLFIEDKIPNGLEFVGFVTTDDGSIGAVKRSDGTICTGKVVDDTKEESADTGVWNADHTEYTYHGLHYKADTNTVSFQVKNLKAGCELTVGIRTKTPTVDDPATPEKEIRRDFYNFATARERNLSIKSNTVHVFMGSEFASLYNVRYEYTGEVPENAPEPPATASYAAGINVNTALDVKMEGYTFSGWSTDDATIIGNSFKMPEADVVLKGSFTKNKTNKVTYSIYGLSPGGYVIPREKDYYPGTVVALDSLKEGDVFNGYRFLGWKSDDVEISSERDFTMPEKDVQIVGEFEEVTYKLMYQFYDTVLPPNADDYLPITKTYKPGATVRLEDVWGNPEGYKFLGWYKEKEFEMPDHDVIVYGEWKVQPGTFEPIIKKEVTSNKDYYRVGDDVEFKITVENTASFPIKNVIVKEVVDNSFFKNGDDYTVISDHVASIDTIPALGSVELFATYKVLSTDRGTLENVVEIKGALADNDYQLFDKEYKASCEFKIQSRLKICKNISGSYNENTFQFLVTGNNDYETWITLEKDQCETIFVDPATYRIKEIVPQEYSIKSISGDVTNDNTDLVIKDGHDYEVNYTNEFIRKGFFHSFGRVINRIRQGE